MPKRKRIPGSIDRRGDKLRVRLYVGGRYHTFTRPSLDMKAAEAFAEMKYRELVREHERHELGLPTQVHFSQLLKEFEDNHLPALSKGTQDAYRDSLKPIRAFFLSDKLRDPLVEKIAAKHIQQYIDWRRNNRLDGKRPLAARTLAKDRAVLHRIFNVAERLEYREGNPVKRVDPPKGDSRTPIILDSAQYERLLAECEGDPMLYLYTLTLGETGARAYTEVLHLRWEDIDLAGGFIWIASGRDGHRTKSGKSRWVPMTPRLAAAMRTHFARYRFAAYTSGPSPWLFHHEISRRHYKAGDRVKDFRRSFDAAAARAKLPKELHRHDLRHRRATSWLAAGANAVHVKEALGHSDLRTTMGYTHLAREHLRSLIDEPSKTESRRGA